MRSRRWPGSSPRVNWPSHFSMPRTLLIAPGIVLFGGAVLVSSDAKRALLLCQCSSLGALAASPSCLYLLDFGHWRPAERPSISPGPQNSALTLDAFVFQKLHDSSKWGKMSHGLGLGVEWDRACPALPCVCEPLRATLCCPMPLTTPELPPSSLPGSLGPSLTRSLQSLLPWILGHGHLWAIFFSVIKSVVVWAHSGGRGLQKYESESQNIKIMIKIIKPVYILRHCSEPFTWTHLIQPFHKAGGSLIPKEQSLDNLTKVIWQWEVELEYNPRQPLSKAHPLNHSFSGVLCTATRL